MHLGEAESAASLRYLHYLTDFTQLMDLSPFPWPYDETNTQHRQTYNQIEPICKLKSSIIIQIQFLRATYTPKHSRCLNFLYFFSNVLLRFQRRRNKILITFT